MAGSGSRARGPDLPHDAIARHLALLPLYITAAYLAVQLAVLLAPPGPRDAEGIVKGHDFSHFYTLGAIARRGTPADLYDPRTLTETMWRVVPETRPDAFQPVYGPQVALAFIPFAGLPYVSAVWAWLATSMSISLAAFGLTVALVGGLRGRRATLWLLLAGSPALNVLLVSGQTSAVALLAVVLAWWALEHDRPIAAGLCLGVLAYKPSLAAGAVAVIVLAGEWRMCAGVAIAAAAQAGVAAWWAGLPVMAQYVAAIAQPVRDAGMHVSQPQHLHSLAGFFRLLLGAGPLATTLYAIAATAVVATAALAWRARPSPRARVGALVLALVLAAPHLYVYDLVVLAPVLVVLWEWAEAQPAPRNAWGRAVAWLAWFAPLAGPIALATSVQWSTPVLVAALVLLSGPGATERQG